MNKHFAKTCRRVFCSMSKEDVDAFMTPSKNNGDTLMKYLEKLDCFPNDNSNFLSTVLQKSYKMAL